MNENKTAPYGALILRVALGILFLAHAWLKYFVFTPAGAVGFFESLGLPGFFAYLTMLAELFGGIALILGLFTRYVSLALVPVILGAIILVHGANGWLFTNPNGGWEFLALWLAALLAQAAIGSGAFALHLNNGKFSFITSPAK